MSMWYQKILQKSYEKLRTNLCKTYEKLTTTLQASYENVKFTASDVIRQTLCQRLLLIEYFELNITDNQSDNFLRMLSRNDLPFSLENLRKSYLADLQKTYENLATNYGKMFRSFENRATALSAWVHYVTSMIKMHCDTYAWTTGACAPRNFCGSVFLNNWLSAVSVMGAVVITSGHKGTRFFISNLGSKRSPPQIVKMLTKCTRPRLASQNLNVRLPPLILHFSHWVSSLKSVSELTTLSWF